MAITLAAATTKFLEIDFLDFRGQVMRKRIQLAGTTTDTNVINLLTDIDGMTNAWMKRAELVTRRAAAGQKSAAVVALEQNIAEVMEYAFLTTNADGSVLTRTVLIPAMRVDLENIDGSPDLTTNTHVATFQSALESLLQYKDSTGTLVDGGFTMSPADSHHVGLPDRVDTQ